MKHLMIDLETLATCPNAVVLTIGAVKFSLSNSKVETLYLKVDVDSCKELGLDVEETTQAWWNRQSKVAREEAFEGERINVRLAFQKLADFYSGCGQVWSNGSVFDIVICQNVLRKLKIKVPWKYWEIRDVRTALSFVPLELPAVPHNALKDAENQVESLRQVCAYLKSCRNKK